MNGKRIASGMLAIGLITATNFSPLAAQVPGVPGAPSIGITVDVKATTLGLGLDVSKGLAPHIAARIGVNGLKLSHDFTFSDIDYSASLNLKSAGAFVDLSVLFLRVTGGIMINKNKLALVADPTIAVQIGNTTYQASDIGTITGAIGFSKTVAPYVGASLVTPGKIGLFLEGGLMLAGDVAVTYAITHGPSLPPSSYAAFDAQVANETAQVQTDVGDKLKAWPVVGIGIQVKL